MRPTAAGHTQQTSTGYIVTRDTNSVRHEKPRSEQTREMIENTASPLKKRPPRDTAAWQATLLANPDALMRDIGERTDLMNRLLTDSGTTAQARSGASRVKRVMASTVSAPDKGNVKANSAKAIQLHGASARPAGAGLSGTHAQLASYTSMNDYQTLMGATHKRTQLVQLQQEATELMDVIESARSKSDAVRKSTTLSEGASIERKALLEAMRSDPDAARKALATRVERCDGLAAAIASHKKAQALLPEERQHDDAANARLTELTSQLRRAQELREVALGLQAPRAAETVMPRLHQLSQSLEKLVSHADTDLAKARKALKTAETAEIDQSLKTLHGLDVTYGREAARSFIRARLSECIGKECDVGAHAMPAPLLVDIYIGALGKTSRPPQKLDDAAHARAMETIAALPGGMLACDQINGAKLGKEQRIANRVEALANTTRARLPASARNEPRAILLEQAARAAAAVKATGSLDGCNEVERACYSAVRNGFAVQAGNDGGIDAGLTKADVRLSKMMSEWMGDHKSGIHLRNPLKNKNPLDGKMLKMAAQTSTLGYDVPERPMARLDDAMRAVVKHLDAIVPPARPEAGAFPLPIAGRLAAASLDTSQVIHLAAVMLATTKSNEQENLRPGHANLGPGDAAALLTLARDRLGSLIKADATPPGLADVQAFIGASGEHAAAPASLLRLFDGIAGHIAAPPAADADASKSHQACHDNVATVRHMIAQTEPTSVANRQEMYDFLAPKYEQFELRGKLKMASGGTAGASTKALTWPLDVDPGALALVIPARGEIKGSKTRSAVMEVGLSTTGAELFAGSETRTTIGGGGGLGVRIGYESLMSSGGGIDKTITRESADTDGVWLRVPRDGDDKLTRRQADGVMQTLCGLDQGGPDPLGADTRIGDFLSHEGTPIMPRIVGELLGRHPNLSMSNVDKLHETVLRNEFSPAASVLNVAGGTGDGASRAQFLGGGAKFDRRNKTYEQGDATGFMQITRSNALSGGSIWAQASVLNVNGAFTMDDTASNGQQYGGAVANRQTGETGVDTKLRYITRDGETNAVDTRIDIEDVNIKNHRKRVNLREQELVALGAEQLFKNTDPKPPLHEQKRVAKQWLHDILAQAEEKSEGNSRHVFSISSCLKPSAAAVIDGLAAKAALARLGGKEDWAVPAERQIDEVLKHKDSFKPWKVTTSERTSESRQMGVTFAVNYTTTRRTEGQRGTSSYPA